MSSLDTAESVAKGHPDKVADQISDAILDAHLRHDRNSRVACETMITSDLVVVAGEITSDAEVDTDQIARETIALIGYTDASCGFDLKTCSINVKISEQSSDIARGVPQGAGDQGLMIGYACRETEEFDEFEGSFMPLPIHLAHRLMEKLDRVREQGEISWLRPDGKCQFTVEYKNGTPIRVRTVVLSTQHDESACDDHGCLSSDAKAELKQKVILPVVPPQLLEPEEPEFLINPTGRFVVGGPQADTGLTGRKIIVDTYGGQCPHGGGAFSGKDPTKVDRSAAYMARHIAKNIVAAGLAEECEVRLAYAIGSDDPVQFSVNSKGVDHKPDDKIEKCVRELVELTSTGIIEHLDLLRPIYSKTTCYGHFGRNDPDFTWERLDLVDGLRRCFE